MKQAFIKGLELSELFYREAVGPLLAKHFPNLVYSAGHIGTGSDVLGFDTPQSRDHDWGPKLRVFLGEADHEAYHQEIDQMLRRELPDEIHGYPTNFGRHEDGTTVMQASDGRPIQHEVVFHTIQGFFRDALKFDPTGEIGVVDWVSVPQNGLLMLTAGRVFHDGLGQLEALRAKLAYYPDDVWLYMLAAQWRRIAQEEAFMGRCGQVGDDLGSRVVAARLVRDLMGLCFLMERRYAPYVKWFGSAFGQLECAGNLTPMLTGALGAGSWQERQTHLTAAYEYAAAMHNGLGITEPLATEVSQFHNRPFVVIHGDRFAEAIRAAIQSKEVLALPEHLGCVDQFVDSTDGLTHVERLRGMYA